MTKVSPTHLSHRWGWHRAKDFDFKLFHKQIGNEGTDRRTYDSTMELFVIITLEEEVCVFEQNSRSVTFCCMDILVLCEAVGPVVIFV